MQEEKKVKVVCGACNHCSPQAKKDNQDKEFTVVGRNKYDNESIDMEDEDGNDRTCPAHAVTAVKPMRADLLPPPDYQDDDDDDDDEEPAEEEEDNDVKAIINDGYGPKCASCGAGRGEDHCATCPYKGMPICAYP